MEGNGESKPKTSTNNTQPTHENAEIVASKIRQFGKGFRIPDDDKKRERQYSNRIRRI